MNRHTPGKKFLAELFGDNERLMREAHHGLLETPLQDFYPHLNLDELLVFEAMSWELRNHRDSRFAEIVSSGSIYNIFNYTFEKGFASLNAHKKLSDESQILYQKLNPFRGRNLEARLARAPQESVEQLRGSLQNPTFTYVSEYRYQNSSNREGLSIAKALGYGIKDKRFAAYIKDIAEILAKYPRTIVPYERPQEIMPAAVQPRIPFAS